MQSDTSVPKLVPKRRVDQDTGTPQIDYYWEGQLAPKVQITGKLVDQLSGYALIKKDLDNSLKWIRHAEKLAGKFRKSDETGYFLLADREVADRIKAYFVASLTFYGKCFTGAAGRHAQISRDWLEPKYRDVHDLYMKYRHNFAAHSGDERLELARTFVLLHPNRTAFLPYLATMRLQPDVHFSNQGDLGFAELIQHAADKVVSTYNKLSAKIIDGFIIPVGVEYWNSAQEKGEPVPIGARTKSKV